MTSTPGPDHARLRRLVAANEAIVSDLDLTTVLRRIVEAALDLVDARYGALGVIAPDGRGLEQFVHVGMDHDAVERIGHLPEGRGILGALIADPRPVRLPHLADDPRSAGFPAGHPPMDSFLGVPVRVRGEVFGNLYLTDAADGEFDEHDEAVAVSLAATAGIAVHNARMYADSGHRQEWLLAAADLTRRVLADPSTVTAGSIAETVATLAGAPLVMVLEHDGPDDVVVTAASGAGAEALTGAVVIPTDPLRRTAGTGDARSVERLAGLPVDARDADGPALLLPLLGPRRTVLVATRPAGGHPFTGPELEMASTFATQVSVALELAQARADQQRMALLEDRARIARDLHDHVIQQLFAAGLTVQGVATTLDDPERVQALAGVVDALDEAVKRVRTSIFHLRATRQAGSGLRGLVLDVVADLRDGLGFEPHVTFEGPVDAVAADDLTEDVLAVVREALTNVARHAGAASAVVRVRTDRSHLVVEVEDDGVGLGAPARSSGLTNLRSRAERRGGRFEIGPGPNGGTRLAWSAPAT
ncbi:MAG: GAF domain-containing sensor histidine kinase [Phycicoccus sp.]